MVRDPALTIIHTDFLKYSLFSGNPDLLELGILGHSASLILMIRSIMLGNENGRLMPSR